MAQIPFQASVVSQVTGTTDVSASNNCLTLLLGDDSNYSTNNDPSSQLGNFSNYRVFTVTYYKGNQTILSSITSPPTCTAASSGQLQVSMPITTGDGYYQYTLATVPTWNSGSVPYTANFHQVYNPTDGNLYTCISSNTSSASNRPDLSPTIWKLIPAANVSTSLFSNYQVSGYFGLTCGIASCLPTMVQNALCQTDGCNVSSFCNNTDFQKAAILFLAFYSVQTAAQQNQIQFCRNSFDIISSLCNCNP